MNILYTIVYNIFIIHIHGTTIVVPCAGGAPSCSVPSCQTTLWSVQKHKIFSLPWPWRVGSRSLSPLYGIHRFIHWEMSPSGHLRIQRLPGADPGWGPSAHSVVKVQIMFLGPDTDKHPQGSAAGAATIHHRDVQQISPRRSPSIFPEVCDPFTNCKEGRTGCWRRSKLSTDIQLDVHVEAYRENGVSAAHSLPRKAQHASETSFRLPRSSFDGNSRSQGHLWYPRCCWPGLRGLPRSPRYVGRVRHGWSWYLAGAAGNIFWDGRHGSGMAIRSFLTGRSQQVSFNGGLSSIGLITTGVPQGSVLGPLLFLLYSADVPLIANQHGLGIHCYADDGQIYVFDKAAEAVEMINKVASCIEEIDRWMSSNRLKLNSEKTQFIWLGSRQQLSKVGVDHIHLGNHTVTSQSTVCNLGIHLDDQLTMKVHVQRISRTSFYQLRQLRSVRRSLSVNACTALVHAFVTSRLDYCNSLLAGIGDGLIDQLQTVMRVAAHLVLRKRKFDPISADIRDRLHWLPIRLRIDFKLGLLVYKCLHGIAPAYLTEMLVLKATVPALSRLRSTARGDLLVPRTKTKTIEPRSFATSGPALWNKLPDDLRDPSLSLPVFKQRLKSYLFKQCWCALQPELTIAATCVSFNAFAFFCEKHRF